MTKDNAFLLNYKVVIYKYTNNGLSATSFLYTRFNTINKSISVQSDFRGGISI